MSIPTDSELMDMAKELANHPSYISRLDDYLKEKVFQYVSLGIFLAKTEEGIYNDYKNPHKKVLYMARMVLMKDRLERALDGVGSEESQEMSGPLLATIHWLNGEPIPKDCEDLANSIGKKKSYLYKCYLEIAKDPIKRRNIRILTEARKHLTAPESIRRCDDEINQAKKLKSSYR